ncbi:MAG: hypothetical protein R3F19_12730 [Verrucomicrobiales bacterium]
MGLNFEDWWIREPAIAGVSRAWTASDPVAALRRWIATLPEGDARNNAIYNLVENIRDADPPSAFHWATSVTDNPDKRLYLLKQATDAWTRFALRSKDAIENLALSAGLKDSLLGRIRNGPQ